MIALAVAAILAVIAFPAYQDSVQKSKRAVAKTALMDIASREEQYALDNKTYATIDNLGFSAATIYYDNNNNIVASTDGARIYSVSASAVTATTFTLTATPLLSQANDTKCGNLTLTQSGIKGISGTASVSACW